MVCAVTGIALVAATVTRDLPGWATAAAIVVGGLLTLRRAYRIVRGLADLLRPASVSGRCAR